MEISIDRQSSIQDDISSNTKRHTDTPDSKDAFCDLENQSSPESPRHRLLPRSIHAKLSQWRQGSRISAVERFLRGPNPPRSLLPLRSIPYFTKFELAYHRKTRILSHPYLIWLFCIAWLIGEAFLVKAAWYNSPGASPYISAGASFFGQNADCGLDASLCQPFNGSSTLARCPANSKSLELLNIRSIGSTEVVYEPLVVGGADGVYRPDSFICAAALHAGVFENKHGGCVNVRTVGAYQNFTSSTQNGISTTAFPSYFPAAYVFDPISQTGCKDTRMTILIYNVIMLAALAFLFQPTALPLYWICVCVGFWHVVLSSDPTSLPPDLSKAFGTFLPTLFICQVLWQYAFRWVMPVFDHKPIERGILFLSFFWVMVLLNLTTAWIPIDRLVAKDIKQEPGALTAIIIIAIIIVILAINQVRVMRKAGWLLQYIGLYLVIGIIIGLLCTLPTLHFRFHHYFAALLFLPATAFPTRLSLFYQGLLLGLFLNGAARWGFDAILQTAEELQRDGTSGSGIPTFLNTSLNFNSSINPLTISWEAIPDSLNSTYNSFSLLIDDILRYSGSATSFSLTDLFAREGIQNATEMPHFARIAYANSGSSADFTRAATFWIGNSTWIDPLPGAT